MSSRAARVVRNRHVNWHCKCEINGLRKTIVYIVRKNSDREYLQIARPGVRWRIRTNVRIATFARDPVG